MALTGKKSFLPRRRFFSVSTLAFLSSLLGEKNPGFFLFKREIHSVRTNFLVWKRSLLKISYKLSNPKFRHLESKLICSCSHLCRVTAILALTNVSLGPLFYTNYSVRVSTDPIPKESHQAVAMSVSHLIVPSALSTNKPLKWFSP